MPITPEELRALVTERQTIRFLGDRKTIPFDVLEHIIDDAQQAPDDWNHQGWKFIVVTDPVLKEKIVTSAGSCDPARRAPVLIVPIIESGWNHNKFSMGQTLATTGSVVLHLEETDMSMQGSSVVHTTYPLPSRR